MDRKRGKFISLGSLELFIEKVKETHGDNKYAKEYRAIAEVIKIRFNEEE